MPVSNPGVTIETVDEAIDVAIDVALEAYVPEEVNYPEVVTHADLPDATEFINETFLVLASTGIFGINRKRAGMWRSNGTSWYRLGALEGSGGTIFSSSLDDFTRVKTIYLKETDQELYFIT